MVLWMERLTSALECDVRTMDGPKEGLRLSIKFLKLTPALKVNLSII